jgi:hypothetical protein
MMPAPLAHFLIQEMAVSKTGGKYHEIFNGLEPMAGTRSQRVLPAPISQWGYVGAAGPDLCGANDDVDWVFDLMHWKKANVFVANWIRDMPDHGEGQKVGTAFILGYLCHMAADILFHPYVNMFAGTYDDQKIKVASSAFTKWWLFQKQWSQMHKYVEVHQDAYVATRYFGAKKVSDGDNGSFPSWSSFMNKVEDQKQNFRDLVDLFHQTVQATYPVPADKKLERDKISDAIHSYWSQLLDLVYDAAIGPIPETPEMLFVSHPARDREYDEFLWAAADLATKFWDAAFELRESPHGAEDRKKFFSVVRPYNLDTGFAIRVYANPWKIYIRHDHSWADILSPPAQAFDPENPPAATR